MHKLHVTVINLLLGKRRDGHTRLANPFKLAAE